MSPKISRVSIVERIGQISLAVILFCCALVVLSELILLIWILQQQFPHGWSVSFDDIALLALACFLALVPFALLILGRRMVLESIYLIALQWCERLLGPHSSLVARTCVALADCYTKDERYDEAQSLFQLAVSINARSGKKSRLAFAIHTELRYLNFLRESGRLETDRFITPYLLKLEKRYHPHHLNTSVLYGLVVVFAFLSTAILLVDCAATTATLAGNYQLARNICEFAPTAPSSSMKVGSSMELLARLYNQGSEWTKAEPLYQTLLDIRSSRDGKKSPAAAAAMQLLSETYLNLGKYQKAQHLLESALEIYRDHAGPDDPRIGVVLNDLATVYCNEDEFDQSQQLFRRALSIYEKHRDAKDPEVAESLQRLARACSAKGQYGQAEPLFKLALAVSEESYGRNDVRVARTLADYAELLRKTGHTEEAQKAETRAREIRSGRGACAGRHIAKVM